MILIIIIAIVLIVCFLAVRCACVQPTDAQHCGLQRTRRLGGAGSDNEGGLYSTVHGAVPLLGSGVSCRPYESLRRLPLNTADQICKPHGLVLRVSWPAVAQRPAR